MATYSSNASRRVFASNQAAIDNANREIAANQQRIDSGESQYREVEKSTEQRFGEMGEIVTKDQYTVLFKTGDYSLSDEAEQGLANIAKQGPCLHQRLGYISGRISRFLG